jgi:hypothetical protein
LISYICLIVMSNELRMNGKRQSARGSASQEAVPLLVQQVLRQVGWSKCFCVLYALHLRTRCYFKPICCYCCREVIICVNSPYCIYWNFYFKPMCCYCCREVIICINPSYCIYWNFRYVVLTEIFRYFTVVPYVI